MHCRTVNDWRKQNRVSGARLARELGVNPATMSRFLTGKTKRPSVPFLSMLDQAMKRIEAELRKKVDRQIQAYKAG